MRGQQPEQGVTQRRLAITDRTLALSAEQLSQLIVETLDDAKAEDIVTIDLRGKSDIADFMVIATGRSQRHVSTLADHIHRNLEAVHYPDIHVEGQEQGDWVLVDTFKVIVHLFHPEVRGVYQLEKMWGATMPERIPVENQIGVYA